MVPGELEMAPIAAKVISIASRMISDAVQIILDATGMTSIAVEVIPLASGTIPAAIQGIPGAREAVQSPSEAVPGRSEAVSDVPRRIPVGPLLSLDRRRLTGPRCPPDGVRRTPLQELTPRLRRACGTMWHGVARVDCAPAWRKEVSAMASVHNVAAYILKKYGRSMTTWKLQKLVYYAQAWSLVWDERPLFQARIEAWANGPVVPALYHEHRGLFKVSSWPKGDPAQLNRSERETVDAVMEFYGSKTAQWLSDLTHAERPWREARGSLAPSERGTQIIALDSMHEYYSGLSGSQG